LYFEKKMSFEVSIDEDRKSLNCIWVAKWRVALYWLSKKKYSAARY
jgi:hypothetical protein